MLIPRYSKGIFFGVLSSCTTAVHSLVIKASLPIVNNVALDLAWYTNLLSAVVVGFMAVFEAGPVTEMFANPEQANTFIIGSAVTVRLGARVYLSDTCS
jgi:GDP-fucose transporter C1